MGGYPPYVSNNLNAMGGGAPKEDAYDSSGVRATGLRPKSSATAGINPTGPKPITATQQKKILQQQIQSA